MALAWAISSSSVNGDEVGVVVGVVVVLLPPPPVLVGGSMA